MKMSKDYLEGITMKKEKFCWSFNKNEEVWYNDTHSSIQECALEAKRINKENGSEHDFVYIGECVPFVVQCDALTILDELEGHAADQCGEIGEEWNSYNYKEDTADGSLEELENAITNIVIEWLKKKGRMPTFWSIENVEKYSLNVECN